LSRSPEVRIGETEALEHVEWEKRAGKQSSKGVCPSQRSDQKEEDLPLPIITLETTMKEEMPEMMSFQTGVSK
jgi:hypothetical protein